ncbi:MAG TPA: serine/threonine-protein kinase [Gemmatimonadales bacterium]|nr:serine/threonine-protein kinase [Gemmatimonadales bacterium]
MSSRRCPRCGATYPAPARFCQNDGSPLIDVQSSDPAAPQASGSRTEVRKAHVTPNRGTDRASTLTGQVLDGRYEVKKKLGEGGMSYVYLAREIASGETVAIKVLSPKLSNEQSSVERLRREAGLAMRLDHPNVCKILRLGETEDGLIYLVMPYLEGDLLSDREIKGGPIPLDQGMSLLIQMCRGLAHAHDLHIIHRDLKPENVMLVKDPEVAAGGLRAIVMDFGLAKERRAEPEVAKLTATGIVLGTPEFMSPEQIRGKPLDGRSDIYALGILAFEMFTGQLPFQGRSAQEMMIARLRGNALPLRQAKPDLPAKLESIIAKSLETEPERRWESMTAFAEALSGVGGVTLFNKLFKR